MMRSLHIRAARLFRPVLGCCAGRLALAMATVLTCFSLSAGAQTAQLVAQPVFIADFNHDGIPDALVLSTTSPAATVILGSVPYGTFSGIAKGVTFPSACQTFAGYKSFNLGRSVLIADFNGDGIPDLAFNCSTSTNNNFATQSGVLLGNGDGTFGTPILLPDTGTDILVAADFNGDGKIDLVAAAFANDTFTYQIMFYPGDGTGHFGQAVATTIGSGGDLQHAVYGALHPDLNGDGYPDLVLVSQGPLSSASSTADVTVSVFGNNKDGTFGVVAASSSAPNTAADLGPSADVNVTSAFLANVYSISGTDILLPDSGTVPGVFALRNTSTATVYSLSAPVKTAVAGLVEARFGNVTGSPFTDIVAANGTTFSVLTNDGSGNYTAAFSGLTFASTANYFAVADANFDGYADIYTASTNANGGLNLNVNLVSGTATATAAPITLGIGSKAISAAWTGNVNLLGSTATGTQLVNGVPSVAVVSSNSNPSVLGAPVTLTALVSPLTASSLIPSGMVTLNDNGTMLTSGTLDSSGRLTYTTSALTLGSHAITATYAGDALFAGTISTALTQVVKNQAVVPILSWANPDPITYGTPLSSTQLDAVATDATGAAVPGVYTYLPAAGTVLGVGAQTLGVTFVPTDTADFLTAAQTVVLQVLQGTPSTTLTVTSAGSATTSVASGSIVTLTASVSLGGAPVSPGQVNFCDASAAFCTDIHLLGTAQLSSTGTAIYRFAPGIGSHTYKAVFLGTRSLAQGASAVSTLTVTGLYPTTAALTQSGSAGNYTLTATIVGTGTESAAPTGVVSFLNQTAGGSVLASAPLGTGIGGLSFAGVASATGIENPQTRGAVADFNGDGILDVATANSAPDSTQTVYANTVTISLGNGDGTFKTSGIGPATGSQPEAIIAADFNGDGIMDLATTNNKGSTVTVLLGNGDGTFRVAATPATADGPLAIVAADFNGDGIMDLAVAGESGYTVLLGNGDGTFAAAPAAETYGSFAPIVSADFNGDGKPDLAIVNYFPTNQLMIFLGNGDGTFTPGSVIPQAGTGSNLNGLAAGDFNGDGKSDLALTDSASNTISILTGNGDGTFVQTMAASATGLSPQDVQVADFNGDGKLDIAVINFDESSARETVLLGNGDGTFTIPAISTGVDAYDAVAIGDFNGDGVPDLLATDGNSNLLAALTQRTQTVTAIATKVGPTGAGTFQVIASYAGDANYAASVSAPTSLMGVLNMATLTWTPAVPSIVYGTALGAQQLNAVATGLNGVPLAGTFTYTPAAGAILHAGSQTLSVSFVPTDPNYLTATATAMITVTQAAPVLTWATPASIAYGIPLGAGQLDATVAGVTGAALPGVLTYTPPAGSVLAPGTQTLNVSFVPTDAVDYTNASGSVKLAVTGLTSTSVSPSTVTAGSGNTTITITGAGFVATSVVQVNGAAVATTLVSPTTLTAVIPAADFVKEGTLKITVYDPSVGLTSPALTLTVAPVSPTVTLGGPTSTPPGSQPTLTFSVTPYPFPLTATLTLSFSASVTPAVDDPAVQFANGGRTLTFVVPANSTTVPTIRVQSGTVAGTITVPLVLTANGMNVTPATLAPVVIVIPPAVPTISSVSMTQSGDQLTVVMHGFSNTREVTQAKFHFAGVAGAQLDAPDVTIPATTLFAGWFGSAVSDQYGSTFTYTQVFNVSDGAANIQSVQVTLTNTVGDSVMQTTQ